MKTRKEGASKLVRDLVPKNESFEHFFYSRMKGPKFFKNVWNSRCLIGIRPFFSRKTMFGITERRGYPPEGRRGEDLGHQFGSSTREPITHGGYGLTYDQSEVPNWDERFAKFSTDPKPHLVGWPEYLQILHKSSESNDNNPFSVSARFSSHQNDPFVDTEFKAIKNRIYYGLKRSAYWLDGDCAVYQEELMKDSVGLNKFKKCLGEALVQFFKHSGFQASLTVDPTPDSDVNRYVINVSCKVK